MDMSACWLRGLSVLLVVVTVLPKEDGIQFVAEQIEDFAELVGIKLERLLLLDVSNVLSKHSSPIRSSLLLGKTEFLREMESVKIIRKKKPFNPFFQKRTIGPWFLSALASPLPMAIVSDGVFFKEFEEEDLYQNIRHKCIVHFFLADIRRQLIGARSMNGIPIYELRRSSSSFTCNRRNAVVSWKDSDLRNRPRECLEAKPVHFRVKNFSQRRGYDTIAQEITLELKCWWNTSVIELPLRVVPLAIYVKYVEDVYMHHTAVNSVVDMNKLDDCVTMLRVKRINMLTLLEPFPLNYWIVFLISVVSLSLTRQLADRRPFFKNMSSVAFNFLNATPITLNSRKSSVQLICCITLAMNFYLSNYYTNDVITRFVDPSEVLKTKNFFQCRTNYLCDHRFIVISNMLHFETAVCGLTNEQKLQTEVPLQRVGYEIVPLDGGERHIYRSLGKAHGFFLKFNGNEIRKRSPSVRGVKLLARPLTQRNEFFVRFSEHAIISAGDAGSDQARSVPSMAEKAFLTLQDRKLEVLIRESFDSGRYLMPTEPRGQFNMLSFAKVAPLFYTAAAFSSVVFGIEKMRILAGWQSFRYRRASI